LLRGSDYISRVNKEGVIMDPAAVRVPLSRDFFIEVNGKHCGPGCLFLKPYMIQVKFSPEEYRDPSTPAQVCHTFSGSTDTFLVHTDSFCLLFQRDDGEPPLLLLEETGKNNSLRCRACLEATQGAEDL
jgi:hypothetical protein